LETQAEVGGDTYSKTEYFITSFFQPPTMKLIQLQRRLQQIGGQTK
jgi:hypothetical protein